MIDPEHIFVHLYEKPKFESSNLIDYLLEFEI